MCLGIVKNRTEPEHDNEGQSHRHATNHKKEEDSKNEDKKIDFRILILEANSGGDFPLPQMLIYGSKSHFWSLGFCFIAHQENEKKRAARGGLVALWVLIWRFWIYGI